jgi:hypothetical protein
MQPRSDTECAEHKHCLTCGYILDNLDENRCPECGRKFNLRIPTTFRLGEEKLLYATWKPYLRWAILISFIPWLGVAIVSTMRPGYSAFPGAGLLFLFFPLWALMMNEFIPFCFTFCMRHAPKSPQIFVRLGPLPLLGFPASSRLGRAILILVQVAAAGLIAFFVIFGFFLVCVV